MKKIFAILSVLVSVTLSSQIINFPDPLFKSRLLNEVYPAAQDLAGNYLQLDANNDNEIEVSEALLVGSLLIDYSSLVDLTGVEYFTNLRYLDCKGNNLNQLNLTELTELSTALVYNNNLTNLEVSGLTNLWMLQCSNNLLTNLDLSGLVSLDLLTCNNNSLSNLELSGLSQLRLIDASNNNLVNINIAGLSNVTQLKCSDNELKSLNLSGLTALRILDCSTNQLTDIYSNELINLQYMFCYNNELTSLNLNQSTALTALDCTSNQLSTIDIMMSPDLHDIDCAYNNLSTLYLRNGTYISYIDFQGNPNLTFICANAGDIPLLNYSILFLNYQCTVDSVCELSQSDVLPSEKVTLYPNPAFDVLNITFENQIKIEKINIYNTLGQVVLVIPNTQKTKSVDVSSLNTGNYFLKIFSDQRSSSVKFVKM